jgi:hypothetical protein
VTRTSARHKDTTDLTGYKILQEKDSRTDSVQLDKDNSADTTPGHNIPCKRLRLFVTFPIPAGPDYFPHLKQGLNDLLTQMQEISDCDSNGKDIMMIPWGSKSSEPAANAKLTITSSSYLLVELNKYLHSPWTSTNQTPHKVLCKIQIVIKTQTVDWENVMFTLEKFWAIKDSGKFIESTPSNSIHPITIRFLARSVPEMIANTMTSNTYINN